MRTIFTAFVFLTSCVLSCKTVYFSTDNFKIKDLSEGDSVLFKRGERYFTHIDLFKGTPENIYFGAYGDTSLAKPVLDGSIYHFDFDAGSWNDHEVINGHKFYKKAVKGLEQVENVYAGSNRLTMAREPDIDEDVVTGQKNSFSGFYKIDSVDVKSPKKVFFDLNNKTDWGKDAEIVTKTQQWSYEVRKFKSEGPRFEAAESTVDAFKKNWGYFVQRSYEALDSKGEWYYDQEKGILYFSPTEDKCRIYVSSNREDKNSGFDIKSSKNIKIENLIFINYKHGIKLWKAKNINIVNCEFSNCTYGVINRLTYLERITVENCSFTDLHSYGIRLIANNSLIGKNYVDRIGLTLGSESRGFNNLNGIEVYGNNNTITGNAVKNTGYCGIRFFNAAGSKVTDNVVENVMKVLTDGGAIYSYHSIDGNKLIKGNTINLLHGSGAGTDKDKSYGKGIYLDELSCNFRVEDNVVQNCDVGIYIQNSNNDTIVHNRTENNLIAEFVINHAGTILNGGLLNPENDPSFDPDSLENIPAEYEWDRKAGILYYLGKKKSVVYVRPGNNLVTGNSFKPDPAQYSIQLKTWNNLSKNTIFELTGDDDFFRNNVSQNYLKDINFSLTGANVLDKNRPAMRFDNIKNDFKAEDFGYIRKSKVIIGRGAKYPVEK